ncbi:Oxygen regulatory protein NreC [Enhygromyxa salina]|uniref:Oxygen regulatory protein NreC n=1 Tax=Enhygromyxa salina TaxID=215803 RepID=A0A2S9YSZ0_9BACT|nr:Oxygen regulatory protein NreC [Enhygromyxa salina]
MLADDHQLVREALARLLDCEPDLTVAATCADGDEALETIARVRPTVAVLDISMPRRTGLEVAAALAQADLGELRIVVLTALRAPELARRAFDHGAQAIVLKDDAFSDLLAAIRAVVADRAFVSAALGGAVIQAQSTSRALLTDRELEILGLIGQGLTNRQIGVALAISTKTVDNHRTRMMRKLDAHAVADLVRHAIRIGLVEP